MWVSFSACVALDSSVGGDSLRRFVGVPRGGVAGCSPCSDIVVSAMQF